MSCVDSVKARVEFYYKNDLQTERTVLRLTLVKGYNMEDVEGISKIVKASCPSFVELKGMTFSGQGCLLSMENCPWYSEVVFSATYYGQVVDFGKKLNELLDDYEISCEHEHSCSVLLTHKKFFYDGKWHTWIDFDKFQELYAKWKQDGTPVNALDYSIETPVSFGCICVPLQAWAVYGSEEQGFDPSDIRRKKRKIATEQMDTETGDN